MPGFDRRGSLEQEPMTGRKKGRCWGDRQTQMKKSGNPNSEVSDVIYGLGRGRRSRCGNGLGSGFGRVFYGSWGCIRRPGSG